MPHTPGKHYKGEPFKGKKAAKKRKVSLGRLKNTLAKKEEQVKRPLPDGRIKHLNDQITSLKAAITKRSAGLKQQAA